MAKKVEPVRAPLILVVDDNEANRALAQGTLEDEGFQVVLANGGAEGIAAFERENPDCIVLDVRMPDIDGFGVCERIRALPQGSNTPVIFLTALRDVDTFDRALLAGGDDFLTKPVRPTELVVRVQTALKLRRLRTELHDHYDLLKKQRDDLMRLQLQKERLMSFVVHDLKNPVNSMDLYAQLLLREKGLSEDAQRSVTQIRNEARHLNRMILNLLDLSKADEGKLVPKKERVLLTKLVAEVFDELRVNAEARQVTLESKLSVEECPGDQDLFRRMGANLVENAVRHAPRGSAVRFTSERSEQSTLLRVADSGSGISEDMREQVFDAFVQLDNGALPPSRGGRGLGLSFCKLVAEAHRGRIWIEDGAPGAVFCVRIPDVE